MITFEDIETNSEQFDAYMEEVDGRLRAAGVPIHMRPFLAFREIAKDGMSMIVGGALPTPHADNIKSWFSRRYDKRLAVDFGIGKAVILVQGDPYILRLPLIFGKVEIDVTKLVEGMTRNLFSSLPKSSQHKILDDFVWLYERFQKIDPLRSTVAANIATAILQMTSQSPHFGESQWASLQATEKALKKFIRHRGERPPHTHDLSKLLSQAETLGLPSGYQEILKRIQCSASVRYDSNVTLGQAVEAHHRAIDVCSFVAENMNVSNPPYPTADTTA